MTRKSKRTSCSCTLLVSYSRMNHLLIYYDSALSRNIPVGTMARRWVRRFEFSIGFRPFLIDYPMGADQPKITLSRSGLLASILQLLLFFASCFCVMYMAPNYVSADDNELVDFVNDCINVLFFTNAVFIFSLVA